MGRGRARDRRLLGWFSLRLVSNGSPRIAELVYRLRRAAWGCGYATEGAEVLIARAFAELGVDRVTATTYEENAASRRVLEKAGLVLVRKFRYEPGDRPAERTYVAAAGPPWPGDDVEYAIEQEAWLRLVR